jgi:uncharacterized protein (DUF433 family)
MDQRDPSALFPLPADPPPFRMDEGGTVRVGNTRITLDLVVEQYENGMTPEDMVRAYDTLDLADVHAVIAYYLRHRDEVREYLKRRSEEAAALREKIETQHPRISRDELFARRNSGHKGGAHCLGSLHQEFAAAAALLRALDEERLR